VGNGDDFFADDIDERYTQTTLRREAYERDEMTAEERFITEQHRAAFMVRAFPNNTLPPNDTMPLVDDADDVPHQTRVAKIRICRAKADFEVIMNIVEHWRPGVKIRDMARGPGRDNIL
jgi:hypothetical protein